ncbi:MAG: hypothetical protein ABIP48_19545 [Planctomycetota bacterium]
MDGRSKHPKAPSDETIPGKVSPRRPSSRWPFFSATRDKKAARAIQERLTRGLPLDEIFPQAADLPEGIPDAQLQKEYSGVGGREYGAVVREIERRLYRCPALSIPSSFSPVGRAAFVRKRSRAGEILAHDSLLPPPGCRARAGKSVKIVDVVVRAA